MSASTPTRAPLNMRLDQEIGSDSEHVCHAGRGRVAISLPQKKLSAAQMKIRMRKIRATNVWVALMNRAIKRLGVMP